MALSLSEGLAAYVPELARSLGQIGPERRPLVVEIDSETMQYRYVAQFEADKICIEKSKVIV